MHFPYQVSGEEFFLHMEESVFEELHKSCGRQHVMPGLLL
jgi:hypothetical protein